MRDDFGQRAVKRPPFTEDRETYRSDPRSRIRFFSRLRASASTCSFHRSLFHSGPPELLLEPNGAGLRLVGEDSSEPRRRLSVASRLGIGLLDLVVGMAHLRTAGDLMAGGNRRGRIAATFVFTSSMPHTVGCAYGHRHPFAPRQPSLISPCWPIDQPMSDWRRSTQDKQPAGINLRGCNAARRERHQAWTPCRSDARARLL